MATRKVVYDDQDTTIIQYSGEWFEQTGALEDLGNLGPPYLHTLHGTNHDATISFEFDGTAVEVYGTSDLSNPKTDPDPNLECFIDGVSIGREPIFEYPENNKELCGTDGLSVGLHKLHIDIKVKSPKQAFWLDRIQYVPSPSVPLDNKMILWKNTDPAIQLDGNWGMYGVFNGTSTTNAVAHVDYIGTSVSWVGYFPEELPHGSAFGTYAIDDGKPIEFNLAGISGSEDPSVYNQVFFTTPEVENGPHTLTVTYLGSGSVTPLTLHQLFIKNGTLLATNMSTSSLPTFPASAATESSTVTTSTSNTETPSVSANAGGESGLNVGALLGGVLGGLGFLILIAGVFLCRRCRGSSGESMVLPFHPYSGLPTSVGRNGTPTPKMKAQAASGNVALPDNRLSAKRREGLRVEAQPVDRSYSKQRIVASGAGNSSGIVHADSGIRLGRPLDDELPPHYTIE